MAKGGGAEIGATKRGKGLKIMAIVDRHGLPLGQYACGQPQRSAFGSALFRLLHDRGQATEPHRRSSLRQRSLDEQLRRHSIEMIAPHRSNRSNPRRKTAADSDDTPDAGW
jgi:hypothetical protein